MKLLVTGATGFVGRHLVPSLYQENEVCCIVRDISNAKKLFSDDVEYILNTDLEKIIDFNPEVVIHLASYLTSADDESAMHKLIESNVIYGVELLNILKKCHCRLFVNFGTFAEYRYGPSECNNAYLYSATKTAFKEILRYYSEISGYKYIHLVPYTIYGGKDSQKKIIDYIRESLNSQTPISMTKGEQILDFIHVNDVVDCVLFLIRHIESFISNPNTIYHLGSGEGHSIKSLANMMENKYNSKANIAWGAREYRPMDIMHAVAPIGQLIAMGWHPSRKLEDNI